MKSGTALNNNQLKELIVTLTRATPTALDNPAETLSYWGVHTAELSERILVALAVPKPKLLRLLGTTAMPARTTVFVARDHFKVALGKKDKVKISFVGDNFIKWFLSGAGKVESPAAAHELAHHELITSSLDTPIVTDLGGEVPAASTLADIWTKMEVQGSGEEGVLLTKSFAANIFYVRDTAGELRVVYVRWYDGGWYVSAFPVSNPSEWDAGYRVFASNSVPAAV
jgi:hypothetical protein